MIDFLFWPLMAALVLSGIHVYLGLHVVTRGVIFVDLALAQVAAVGATVGVLLGLEPAGLPAYLVALGFTFLGAALFTFTRRLEAKIPQEAVIGITYAVAAAVMILLLSKAVEGAEHINTLLVGSILFVTPEIIGYTFLLYAVIGLVHFLYRRRFMEATRLYGNREGKNAHQWWDFLFYVTFGFVVTSAVKIVGVLLVFSFLIIPAVAAILFVQTWRGRLIFGWIMSMAASILGMAFSLWLDVPTGAAIVATFGILLVFLGLVKLGLNRT